MRHIKHSISNHRKRLAKSTEVRKNNKKAVVLHQKLQGKILVQSKITKLTQENLKLIYTPGVADVCKEICNHPNKKYTLTSKSHNVAIVTDGTRILGLGNIGPYAALPVMEGKAVIYRKFGEISAFPICLNTTKKQQIINAIKAIEPAFGAINLEDIESPKVLEISDDLEKELPIPVFHDDRHGTAVVVLAALMNSLRLVKKSFSSIKVVVAGAGSAGYGIVELLYFAGCKNIIVVDSVGAIHNGRVKNMNKYKQKIASFTNPSKQKGNITQILKNSDVFIGVSGIKNLLAPSMIKQMKKDPIIFALTNPEPEIRPDIARKAGAKIIATGSYEYENKVNNAVVFPYLMRGILDLKIRKITKELLLLTATALAKTVESKRLDYSHIVPEIGDKNLQRNINVILKKYCGT